LQKEIKNLSKVLKESKEGKILILGGAKISTKVPVIKNFFDKAEYILIGGAIIIAILKFKGFNIGSSKVEDGKIEEVLKEIDWSDPKFVLPVDLVASSDKTGKSIPEIKPIGEELEDNQYILDVGPETIKEFSSIIKNSKIIIFNGPLGLAEVERFSLATRIVLESIANSKAFSVVGGGDTLALVEKWNLFDKFSYVSTGGGAMLEFLAGNELPGLKALGYNFE